MNHNYILPVKSNNDRTKLESFDKQKEKIDRFKRKLFKQERDRLWKILKKIRLKEDLESFLLTITAAIKQELQLDRVCIYRFDLESGGEKGQIIAESASKDFTPTLNEILPSLVFGAKDAAEYYFQGLVTLDVKNLSAYQKQVLTRFQVRSSVALPILLNSIYSAKEERSEEVWGLLVAQQCQRERQWQENEINLLDRISREITIRLQQDRSEIKLLEGKDILSSIERSMTIKMQAIATKVRQSLEADRAIVWALNPDWSGKILAESVGANCQKVGHKFAVNYFLKEEENRPYYLVNNIESKKIDRHSREILEKFAAKAYLKVPIEQNGQLLGFLAVYYNSTSRNWSRSQINLTIDFASKLSFPLQQTATIRKREFEKQQSQQIQKREKELKKTISLLRKAKNEELIFQVATQSSRKILAVDRAVIYRFNSDWRGEFVAQSHPSNIASLAKTIKDIYWQENRARNYKFGECFAVEDIDDEKHPSSNLELLKQFEARAYAIAPIMTEDNKLWGVLGVYQNSKIRKWQPSELEALKEIATQLSIARQKIEYIRRLEQKAERETVLNKIVARIRESLNLKEIFETTTREIRNILKCDRVAIYRFNPDWSGEFVAESRGPEWLSLLELQHARPEIIENVNECSIRNLAENRGIFGTKDTRIQETKGSIFNKTVPYRISNDIYQSDFSDCYLKALEAYQAKAYIIFALYQKERLWGLLAVYQNSSPRNWQESEVKLLNTIASQLGVAVLQAEYARKIEIQSLQEAATAQIVARIRQSLNLNEIFERTTWEIRNLLKCDRTAIYRFNPNWSGEFVAESRSPEWVSLLELQKANSAISENIDSCSLKNLAGDRTVVGTKDTYIEETKGSIFSRSIPYRISNDIYNSGFSDCYIRTLEAYQAKAYVIIALYHGEKLWGLLAAYQNSSTRNWQESEVKLLNAIASQLGVAVLQAEYADRLEEKSKNLDLALEREKTAKENLEKQAIAMLKSIEPAFKGDLRVRADVTRDRIGTIAAAYNTTLDSLQDIVIQVKNTVKQVVETTNNNNTSIEVLSSKAQLQTNELNHALAQIQETIETSQLAALNARQVESAIEQANLTVQSGDRAMDKSVASINEIRSFAIDAGKRIKHLRESSQRISKVVSLISSFAAQTNILALNATLEATRAGEYGKGFGVVADEVRNLSLQSAEATTEIEKLIQNIQAETIEVSAAMEKGIEQVERGTHFVNETRENLNQIVTSTGEISQLVKSINNAANAQSQQAESVMSAIGQIATIAHETSDDSLSISASFAELLEMVAQLQNNISQFKVE